MKISIITVCFNSEKTIRNTIISVLNQDYKNIEYIIVDGGSSDGTLDIINDYADRITTIISEPDFGIYDAMNKGINVATGEYVGILNSDDEFFLNNTLSEIANCISFNSNIDAVYGDIIFEKNNKIIRKYSAKNWNENKFKWGFMPPHPSFYCKRHLFEKFGYYRTDLEIASDFELLIRFLKVNGIHSVYMPSIIVKMKFGGKSTKNILSNLKIIKEVKMSCRLNGIYTNNFMLVSKYLIKIFDFF